MNELETARGWLESEQAYVSCKHEDDKLVVCERAGLLFVFNFHTHKSFSDYRVGTARPGCFRPILCSDEQRFGGHDRVTLTSQHFTQPTPWHDRPHSLLVSPPRPRKEEEEEEQEEQEEQEEKWNREKKRRKRRRKRRRRSVQKKEGVTLCDRLKA